MTTKIKIFRMSVKITEVPNLRTVYATRVRVYNVYPRKMLIFNDQTRCKVLSITDSLFNFFFRLFTCKKFKYLHWDAECNVFEQLSVGEDNCSVLFCREFVANVSGHTRPKCNVIFQAMQWTGRSAF